MEIREPVDSNEPDKVVEVATLADAESQQKAENDEKDPESWIKENILQKGNIIRSCYLNKLGFNKPPPMTKEEFDKMNEMTKSQTDEVEKDSKAEESSLQIENSYSLGDFSLNFMIKTDDEIRKNFIGKLQFMKMIKPQTAKKHQSSIPHTLLNMLTKW